MNKMAIVERDMEALLFKVQVDMSKLMRESDELVAALQECADVLDSALASLGYPAGIGDIALSNARAALAKVSK